MALSDVTASRAVEEAIDEFDRLGRDAFLDKYGFGQAREYFVKRNGKLYDSKAIAGAAHGFQFPELGPLRPTDFSGGDATVRVRLESLGFKVVVLNEVTGSLSSATSAALEREFHQRMIAIYVAAKKEARYNATRFLTMVNERGGVETARILLHATSVSEGYTALWERQRLDLTVEALVLEERWQPLFSADERKIAIRRLREYNYPAALPDQ
jgi:hypothetical protein